MNRNRKRVLAAVLAIAAAGCQAGAPKQAEAADAHASIPAGTSVTVYPIVMVGQPRPEVGQFVAQLLERGGLVDIAIAEEPYRPAAEADFDAQQRGFAAYTRTHPPRTAYALYGAYFGTPQSGVESVCAVIVDREGRIVWSDRQAKGDAAFDRAKPKDPMSCTVLLVNRLRGPLHLDDPFRKGAPSGAMAERARRAAGIPDARELAAMEARRAKLPEAGATVAVYPTRVGEEFDAAAAEALANAVAAGGRLKATAESEPLRFRFEGSMNEQKVLWSAARSLQEAVRARRPDADYVLIAHVVSAPGKDAFAVHTFLLDRKGELVFVDHRNAHHADFRAIDPTSRTDCAKLSAARLARSLR